MNIYANGTQFPTGDLKTINIYGNGEILFTLDQGYIEECTTDKTGLYSRVASVDSLYLENDIKRSIKLNLSRQDNFWMVHKAKYSFDCGKDLYIHCSEINVIDDGEKLATDFGHEKNYLHAFRLLSATGFEVPHRKYYFIDDENFTIPENWILDQENRRTGTEQNPCYRYYDSEKTLFKNKPPHTKGIVVSWVQVDTMHELPTAQRYYCKSVYDDFRIKCNHIADVINEKGCLYSDRKISHYEVERILQYFDITEKGAFIKKG